MKQVNSLNARFIRKIVKTYDIVSLVSMPKTVAVTICHTYLSFYIENVLGFTGNW